MALTITIPGAVETTTGSTAPAVLTVGVGSPGVGVPSGGTAGQVLQKLSGVSYDTGWLTLPADFITSVTAPLAVASGVLSVDLSAYSTTAQAAALYYPLSGNPSAFLVAADITGKANLASPDFTGNVTITSNSGTAALTITQDGAGDILRLNDVAGDTTFTFVDAAGKVNTIASTTASAGLNVAHGAAPTSPVNGDIFTTTSGLFVRINSGTQQFAALSTNNNFSNANGSYGSSTGAGTINLASGATISASTKAVNIGTGGVVGSTTTTIVGPVLGASTTTIGATTAASTLNLATGATLTATTKAVNIGTLGVAGSTTNIAIGSTTGTSTTTLQGITNGITQTAADSSLKLATTAFVTTADNLKANLASPTFTGTPTLPTGTIGTTQSPGDNTTALATTAFVTAAVPAFATNAQALTGTSATTGINPLTAVISQMNAATAPSLASSLNAAQTAGSSSTFINGATFLANGTAAGYVSRSCGSFIRGGSTSTGTNWTRPVAISARIGGQTAFQTQCVYRLNIGSSTATLGTPTVRSIGVRFGASATSVLSALILEVHNGTSLTSVTTSFTPTLNQMFDVAVYSDGAGNAYCYVNGSEVGSSSSAPSTAAADGQSVVQVGLQNVTTPTATSTGVLFNLKFLVN